MTDMGHKFRENFTSIQTKTSLTIAVRCWKITLLWNCR